MIENRAVGIKSRELYEAPAAMTLIAAHQALEDLVLTKAECEREARARDDVGEARLRRPLVLARPRGARRVRRRRRRSSSPARCGSRCRPGAAVVDRAALGARALRARLASYGAGETFPHEAAEGFIKLAALEAELARGPRAQGRAARDALGPAASSGGSPPTVWDFLRADDAELLPYDCAATLVHARRLHAAGLLTTRSSPRSRRRSQRIAGPGCRRGRGRPLGDRAAARRGRAQDPRRPLAERPGRRRVPALRRATPAPRRSTAIDALAARVLDRAEAEAETPMPGYTHLQRAQPVTVGHHLLAWVEMLERDLARFALAAQQADAVAARRRRAGRLDAAAPAAAGGQVRTRWTRVADRDFALDYLYACAVLFTHLSRIGEELVPLGDERVRLRAAAGVRGDRARR